MNTAFNSRNYQRRPASIAELAERALDNDWGEHKDLKYYLRLAEKHRREGKEYVSAGDLENAFVEYAKAATLVLEKLPTHRDYQTLLTVNQRHNLGLNGQEILDSLGELKPTLVERHDQWLQNQPEDWNQPEDSYPSDPHLRHHPPDPRSKQQNPRSRDYPPNQERTRQQEQEQERAMGEELRRWQQQREDAARVEEEERNRRAPYEARRKEAAVAAARQAAARPSNDYTFSRSNGPPGRSDSAEAKYNQQQEEMRRREEEIKSKREQKRREQEGIARRQQEADDTARAVRQNIAANNPGTVSAPSGVASIASGMASVTLHPSTTASSNLYNGNVQAPVAVKSRPPSFLGMSNDSSVAPSMMPLESPTRYDGDSTDSESVANLSIDWHHRAVKTRSTPSTNRTPSRAPARSPSYPPPITTTSPPPMQGSILYPQLMSQHQKTQGYYPSLNSMFTPESSTHVPASLLFVGENRGPPSQGGSMRGLYPQDALPRVSAASAFSAASSFVYPQTIQQQPGFPQAHHAHPPPPQQQQQQQPNYPGPTRPQPAVPTATPVLPQSSSRGDLRSSTSTSSGGGGDGFPALKHVNLPRECLQRFLGIAKVNTSMNKETCGLLLGKDRGHKFIVTTLLIPKQHSTSDTCTMDEEELVLQFTEERSLITLGWIHTHPSQSCFMSSVDLHTHSGFQRMLPESFAVVCAPKSNPNFGIFRLTDPPGLQTVLECQAKEAFHPHPDLPIYTDADKGHVQMKDISLEIVDLR